MISTTLSPASAGTFGPWSADVRPYACAAVRISLLPTSALVQGTGLPAVGMKRRDVADLPGTGFPAALPTTEHDVITQNDGTTPLGIHSPGRPTS
jgi:hypothetical protein